jgi:hypothetical protein
MFEMLNVLGIGFWALYSVGCYVGKLKEVSGIKRTRKQGGIRGPKEGHVGGSKKAKSCDGSKGGLLGGLQ